MRGVDVRGLGAILEPEVTHVGSYIVEQSGDQSKIESSKSLNKLEKLERSKQQEIINARMVNSLVSSGRTSSDVNRR